MAYHMCGGAGLVKRASALATALTFAQCTPVRCPDTCVCVLKTRNCCPGKSAPVVIKVHVDSMNSQGLGGKYDIEVFDHELPVSNLTRG